VIQMLSPGGIAARRTTHALATFGDFGTRSIEFSPREPGQRAELDVDARAFATDGFSLMAPERRGPIDIAAWSRHRWLSARWRQSIGNQLEFSATARGYEEKRGNGTPYQQNSSREKFISLALAGQPANEFAWNAVAYAQDQTFASTFSGVNATRTAETPASDQFAVPATAIGAAWTGVWRHLGAGTGAALSRSVAGVDARFVRGETREHFTFSAGNFTRLRVAGGRQEIAGAFAMHERQLWEDVRGTIGVRLDRWAERDGHRRESDRTTNVFLRNDRYADREGTSFSPNLGLVWRVPESPTRVRVHVQRASRRPTLNELYRPFRVGPNITEANAALGTEHVTSAEVGVEWRLFPRAASLTRAPGSPAVLPSSPAGPDSQLTVGVTAFHNDLRDAVSNVTVARGPGTFPLFGTIACSSFGPCADRFCTTKPAVRKVSIGSKCR
jgi:hypothetical protein